MNDRTEMSSDDATGVVLPTNALDWIHDLTDARAARKQAEQSEAVALEHLEHLMGDADIATIDGVIVLRRHVEYIHSPNCITRASQRVISVTNVRDRHVHG